VVGQRLDGRLEVWNVDIFQLNRERIGVFDGIWDRGSLVALNPKDRDRYFKVIIDVLGDDGVYLLDSFCYKAKPGFFGPPFIFDEDDIVKTLGHILSCKKLENFSNEAMLEKVGSWGITEIRELVHVLTLRKKDQEAS
jgi:thiopurine S-methyltransferase